MLNRITYTQINDVVQRNLSANYKKLAGLQEQLSTNSSSESDQKLSRTERRKQERELQKKR